MHGLLHIADGIKAAGPVWATWSFAMEQYCSYTKQNTVQSRKHLLVSINNQILKTTQLEMAKMKYGLVKTLSLKPKHRRTSKDRFPNCVPHSITILFLHLTTPTRPPVHLTGSKANTPSQPWPQLTAH